MRVKNGIIVNGINGKSKCPYDFTEPEATMTENMYYSQVSGGCGRSFALAIALDEWAVSTNALPGVANQSGATSCESIGNPTLTPIFNNVPGNDIVWGFKVTSNLCSGMTCFTYPYSTTRTCNSSGVCTCVC